MWCWLPLRALYQGARAGKEPIPSNAHFDHGSVHQKVTILLCVINKSPLERYIEAMKISYYSSDVLPRVLTSIDDCSPNQLSLWWPNGVFKKENKNFVIFLLLVFLLRKGIYLFTAVQTLRFLIFQSVNNPLLPIFIMMSKLCQIWPVGVLSHGLLCPFGILSFFFEQFAGVFFA